MHNPKRRIRSGRLFALALVLSVAACQPQEAARDTQPQASPADQTVIIATSLPATYSIGSALAAGTGIDVRLVPEGGRRMSQLRSYFERQAENLAEELANVDAVITIGKLWTDDVLFTIARQANIRVIDIDATKPWSIYLEGIAVASEPASNVAWASADSSPGAAARPARQPSSYFWLSPANGARAADIIASDLVRLAPDDAERINRNLEALRSELLGMQADYQLRLAELIDVTVFALAPEFVYLTNAFGIYVDGYFLKQDIDWTDTDRAALTQYLADNDIGVVIHKWEPDASIAAAVADAGASLVVLDPIDIGVEAEAGIATDSYQQQLRGNLEALLAALAGN